MSEELPPEARADARQIFEGKVEGRTACHFCAGIHAHVAGLQPRQQPCPRVKRIERHSDGTVLAVEHWPPGRWESDVVFPRDVYDDTPDTN